MTQICNKSHQCNVDTPTLQCNVDMPALCATLLECLPGASVVKARDAASSTYKAIKTTLSYLPYQVPTPGDLWPVSLCSKASIPG